MAHLPVSIQRKAAKIHKYAVCTVTQDLKYIAGAIVEEKTKFLIVKDQAGCHDWRGFVWDGEDLGAV